MWGYEGIYITCTSHFVGEGGVNVRIRVMLIIVCYHVMLRFVDTFLVTLSSGAHGYLSMVTVHKMSMVH